MYRVPPERFEELAAEALESLPAELARAVDNVVVVVEDFPEDGEPLLGLYQGIPLTKRGPVSYTWAMPDRITLFQDNISSLCSNEEQLIAQIRKTVIHEVAHHFGISDARLRELGWA